MLAFIQLINRSGAMVLPFLSIYITESLGFDIRQAGIILSFFGIGSMIGSYFGGRLTDSLGAFKVQLISLFGAGLCFFILMYLQTFWSLAIGILITTILTDMLRPANTSAVSQYSKPENFTRSFSLNRMSVNLGFAIGPALGGLLASISYGFLFMADGTSCILAGVVFYFYFRNRKPNVIPAHEEEKSKVASSVSPLQDTYYIGFVVLCCFYAMAFLQLLSALPLYYKQVHNLSETGIGLLLGFNGLIVFLFEMITVYIIEKKYKPESLIVFGTLLLAASFALINIYPAIAILYLAMLLMSFSEIFAMPFMISFAVHRASDKTRGSYVGLYTLGWSVAFIVAPYISTMMISKWNYTVLWWVVSVFSLGTALLFYILLRIKPKK